MATEPENKGRLGEPEHLPRKERELRRHQQELLETAESLLEEHRYQEITVQAIVAASEFSVGYIYKLFPSKEEIYSSLIRAKGDALKAVISDCLSANDGDAGQLASMTDVVLSWLSSNRAFATSFVRELRLLPQTDPGLGSYIAQLKGHMKSQLGSLFSEEIRVGRLAHVDPGLIARTFISLLWGLVGEDIYESPKADWTRHGPTIVRIIQEAFRPGAWTS